MSILDRAREIFKKTKDQHAAELQVSGETARQVIRDEMWAYSTDIALGEYEARTEERLAELERRTGNPIFHALTGNGKPEDGAFPAGIG